MQRLAITFINFYQKYLRCFLPCSCRFWPTCSDYAKQAFIKYGFWRAAALAAKRLLRCHPFSGRSGYDPLA